MDRRKCRVPLWRWLIFVLAVLAVFLAVVVLCVAGWLYGAGLLYSLAVFVLFGFALIGSIALAFLVYALFRRWCELAGAPPKGQGTREQSGPIAARVGPTIYKRPDPLIYSQYFLMSQGLAVTWDNPDIWLTELPAPDGTMKPVASHEILPNHTYRVHARIHNGSLEAPAVGMPVAFGFLSFGIGVVPNLIGFAVVNVPVRGAVGHPVETFNDWLTPATPGHYCLQVGLLWPDDAQPANNLGQENIDIKKLASPATFQFPVRNDAPTRRHYRLEADAYPSPVPPACPERKPPDPTGREPLPVRDPAAGAARRAAHRREAHPLPPGWSVDFSPAAEFVLSPGEQVDVIAAVNAPGPVPAPRPINVNAFADGVLAGGVTLYVHS
jgi:hypothetical protein